MLNPNGVNFFIWATDADAALELAGNGADQEFASLEDALAGFDGEYHGGKGVFEVSVERRTENK